MLAGLTADKLSGPPYRGYHYSNLAYGLLGAMLTRLTGAPWDELVGEQILAPLGMRRTTYSPAEPFARGYVVHPWQDTLREEPRLDAGAMAPAGQLWSTVSDLARWAAFLADPAATPGVLAEGTVAEMCTPVTISDLDSWTAGHGLGLELWRRGERVYVGHTGSMPGYNAVLAVHRPSRTGVVAYSNAYTTRGGGLARVGLDLLTEVLDAEPARTEPWRPGAANARRGAAAASRARSPAAGSGRCPRTSGGRDFSTLAMKTCSRESPISTRSSFKSWPARPTKGSPWRSSSAPGASPTNIRSASALPAPKTALVRVSCSGHFVHLWTSL